MISVSGKNWEEIIINQNSVDKLKQDLGFNDILSRLIVSRKFNEEEIASINNNLNLNNVFHNTNDFKKSIRSDKLYFPTSKNARSVGTFQRKKHVSK